jgi:hypothetical protein
MRKRDTLPEAQIDQVMPTLPPEIAASAYLLDARAKPHP